MERNERLIIFCNDRRTQKDVRSENAHSSLFTHFSFLTDYLRQPHHDLEAQVCVLHGVGGRDEDGEQVADHATAPEYKPEIETYRSRAISAAGDPGSRLDQPVRVLASGDHSRRRVIREASSGAERPTRDRRRFDMAKTIYENHRQIK